MWLTHHPITFQVLLRAPLCPKHFVWALFQMDMWWKCERISTDLENTGRLFQLQLIRNWLFLAFFLTKPLQSLMTHIRIWNNSCRESFFLNVLLSECLEDSLEHSWLQNPKRGVSRRVSAVYVPVNQRRSSHCSWARLQNAIPRPPTQVLYVHPAPPVQQADTLTFKSLRCGHLKRALKCKRWPRPKPPANLTPRCNRQVFSQPIRLLVACADVSDAQEVPRVAGPDVGEKKYLWS